MQRMLMGGIMGLIMTTGGGATLAAEPMQTILTLHQTAESRLPPDLLALTLRAEAEGADAATAQAGVNRMVAAAIALAKATPEIGVVTGDYATHRVERTGSAGTVTSTWRAAQTVILRSSAFDAVMAVGGRLQQDGLALTGLEYHLAEETRTARQKQLIRTVFAALRTQADQAAEAMGLVVVGYKTVTLSQPDRAPVMPKTSRSMMVAAEAAPPPQGEPEPQSVGVAVDAEMVLAPPRR